jgi:YidC/Oxa1 family membrane protein insertase
VPAAELAPDGRRELALDVFAGPKLRGLLAGEGLYSKLNYLGTIDLGGCFCASSHLTFGMMWLLEKLAYFSFGNYGVAIILLVFLVLLALHPLTKKGQVSMMKMQKLAPQMQKLKEKYADDKNALNREMMQLYKQGGATPILGCLPMLLQTPIWIALWTVSSSTVELRQAAFLPFWLVDLGAPDALFTFPRALPWIGQTFNLLPILVAISFYLQSKIMPTMTQASPSAQQAQQQKIMNIMMPVMMLVFLYPGASGLSLYMMASNFARVIEQHVIRKHIRQREAREAAAETTVSVPGKGSRSGRPKKPKGPLWFKKELLVATFATSATLPGRSPRSPQSPSRTSAAVCGGRTTAWSAPGRWSS